MKWHVSGLPGPLVDRPLNTLAVQINIIYNFMLQKLVSLPSSLPMNAFGSLLPEVLECLFILWKSPSIQNWV